MKKTSNAKSLRNIVIGLIILGIAVYFVYLNLFLVKYSLDRAMLLDDAVRFGWSGYRTMWFNATIAAENAFIENHMLARIATLVPVIGKIAFIIVTFYTAKLGYAIVRCNLKHLAYNR